MAERVIGRDAELARVEAFLDGTADAFASLVLVGEPGIGKTVVWREAVDRAKGRGYQVLMCRPTEAEAKLSFAGLGDLLESVPVEAFDGLPEPQRHALDVALLRAKAGGRPADARAIGAGLRGVLERLASRSPVVLAIDDLHWLDMPSFRALDFSLRRLRGQRLGLVATRRADASGLCGGGDLGVAEQLRLGSLSLAAIHNLLMRRLGRSLPRPTLVRLHETARGNPLFALEIARELVVAGREPADALPVPDDLRQLVSRRVARLSRAAREVLLVSAAVREPTCALVSGALGSDPTIGLEEAERAEIITIEDGRVVFAHPLYATAVLRGVAPARRREVHRRLSRVVIDGEERALHLALATESRSEKVATIVDAAARGARDRGAAGTAASLLLEASRLTPDIDAGRAHERAFEAAECLFDAADTAGARAILESLLGELPPGPGRARALLLMALIHSYEDGPAPAKRVCMEALQAADGDARLGAEIHLRFSFVCVDDLDLARQSARRAREAALSDPEAPADLVAAALLEDAYLRFLAGGGIARKQVERAERLMPSHGRTWLAQRAHAVLQVWFKYLDELPRARDLLEQAARQRSEEGDEYEAALITAHLAEVECWLGNWAKAGEHADAGAIAIEQAGNPLWRARTLYGQALLAAHVGADAEARAAALAGFEIAEQADDPWIGTLNLSVLGFLELSLGDLAAADGWLTRAETAVTGMGLAEPARFRFHGDQLETVIGLGQLDRAEGLLAQLEHRGRRAPRPWTLAVAWRCRALLQAARGEIDAALASAERALDVHERLPMPFEQARTLLALGQLKRRHGERRAAREVLERALSAFDQLGSPHWSERAAVELRRIPMRGPAPGGLTPTEERVAALAAAGRTNREVAQALFMSPKTVEANLTRIYRKLGVRSRAELGATIALRERGDDAAPKR